MTLSEVSYNYGTTEEVILRLVEDGIISYDEDNDGFDYDELVDNNERIVEAIFGIILENHYSAPHYVGDVLLVG